MIDQHCNNRDFPILFQTLISRLSSFLSSDVLIFSHVCHQSLSHVWLERGEAACGSVSRCLCLAQMWRLYRIHTQKVWKKSKLWMNCVISEQDCYHLTGRASGGVAARVRGHVCRLRILPFERRQTRAVSRPPEKPACTMEWIPLLKLWHHRYWPYLRG